MNYVIKMIQGNRLGFIISGDDEIVGLKMVKSYAIIPPNEEYGELLEVSRNDYKVARTILGDTKWLYI